MVSLRLRVLAAVALLLQALAAQRVCPAAVPAAGQIAGRPDGPHHPTGTGLVQIDPAMHLQRVPWV